LVEDRLENELMSAIEDVFARCRSEKRAAFIPYLTGGDPDFRTSTKLLESLIRGGADLIEVGVPFSDPIADGPTNQRAATRALEAGIDLSAVLDLVAHIRRDSKVPIVLFTYLNPILSRGLERFAEQAADSGVDGVLCVDLPPDEAADGYIPAMRRHGIDTVFLLAPTSTPDRVRQVADASTGFVYYVSRTGVTGVQSELSGDLLKEVKRLRRRVRKPVVVGFGVSSPEQVGKVGHIADGVVVGSALVQLIELRSQDSDLPAVVEAETRRLSSPLHDSSSK
jgi:tryptophan synthase alpha chain